ncbi:hypothetical protein [Mucilaginibacter galii]|uniref:hypothetical protein n=1 Tax=Mucilaginibacter galii TaxID=2005073 RepID=UPI001669AB7D|nr:hypothetical protein [Mucilaginibacter galii]
MIPDSILSTLPLGVPSGPGYPLIRLQALRTRPVSATTPNAWGDVGAVIVQ